MCDKNSEFLFFKSEIIDTHGGSIRVYVKKDNKVKIESSVKKMLKDEENFGIKNFKTYQKFGEQVYQIKKNVLANIKKLRKQNKKVIGLAKKVEKQSNIYKKQLKKVRRITNDNKTMITTSDTNIPGRRYLNQETHAS